MRDAVRTERVSGRGFPIDVGKYWENYANLGKLVTMTNKKRQKSAEQSEVFPGWLPWEEFTARVVTIEELRERIGIAEARLILTRLENLLAPVLNRTAFSKVIASADVGDDQRAALEQDLAAIGVWYLTPGAQVAADADLDATRRYLRDLKKHSTKIWPSLHHVLALLPGPVLHKIELDNTLASHSKAADLSEVRNFMADLPALCDKLIDHLSPKQVGRRENFVLDHSVRLTRTVLAAAGLPVTAKFRNAAGKLPELIGAGAPLMQDYFKSLDPRLGASGLARALIRVQRADRA